MTEQTTPSTVEEDLRRVEGRRLRSVVSADDDIVRGHLVHGVPVLPGVFHLDLVMRLLRHAGVDPATAELRRCLFINPVVPTAERARELQVVVGTRSVRGDLPVTVRSRPLDGGGDAEDADWMTNFQAEIRFGLPPHQERLDLPGLLASRTEEGDLESLYAYARHVSIHHQGFMKVDGRFHSGPGLALADVRLGDEAAEYLDYFHMHPVVLDFATLVLFLHFRPEQRQEADRPFVPIYIESFRATGRLGRDCHVHVPPLTQRDLDGETITADLRICSPDGELLATLTGFREKRVRSAEHFTRLIEDGGAGALDGTGPTRPPEEPPAPQPAPPVAAATLDGVVSALVSDALEGGHADPDLGFFDLGLTSVDLLGIAGKLEKRLGTELYPTLLFEYPTVRSLASHLRDQGLEASPEPPTATGERDAAPVLAPAPAPSPASSSAPSPAPALSPSASAAPAAPAADEPIAIVGVAGRYPNSPDVNRFWEVLRDGRDCVTEIPPERWDFRDYYEPRRDAVGRSHSKWGAFLDGVDLFDPHFFNVSARQAELMDPHERLFLETAWETVEDAGYTPESLGTTTGGRVGVFTGAMWSDYQLYGLEEVRRGNPQVVASTFSLIPNRVSYTFDFQGPSVAVDSACSSSLLTLHMACQSIRNGECRAALAGGVNLSLHPYKYLRLSEYQLLSPTGRCRIFGRGADGYVPGEGVGAVLVRPLSDALAAGDHIYGVVRASAAHHGGRTSGFAVPSPEAQSRVILDVLEKADVPVETITSIEAHGGATTLGDQIEIAALTKAFRRYTRDRGYCAIGSLKSNVGHLESAAGVAALTKVLLSMRHRTIVPSLHTEELNPKIPFGTTPFYVPREATPWERVTDPRTGRTAPLRAAVSAFGFGGANVHVLLEEWVPPSPSQAPALPVGRRSASEAAKDAGRFAVPLSARGQEALREQARRLRDHLLAHPELRVADVAHTLGVGRRAMESRLVVVARDTGELTLALEDFLAGRPGSVPRWSGRVSRRAPRPAGSGTATDAAGLAERWVNGEDVAWQEAAAPGARRVPLPTYAFARQRCWVPGVTVAASPGSSGTAAAVPVGIPGAGKGAADAAGDAVADSAGDAAVEGVGDAAVEGVGDAAEDGAGTSGPPIAHSDRTLLYAPVWKPRPLAGPPAHGTLLVFDTSPERVAELRRRVGRVVQVRPGAGFTRLSPDEYQVDPTSRSDHDALFRALGDAGVDPAAVLHLWRLDAPVTGGADPDAAIIPLFLFCRAWAVGCHHELPVVHAFRGEADLPTDAAAGGFARSTRLEQPKLCLKAVDLRTATDVAGECALLLAEAASAEDIEVRHTAEGRAVLKFARVPWPRTGTTRPAREGGTYLVVGGAGGVGRHVARHMATTPGISLMLSGRSEPGPEHRALVAELEALGARAAYLPADVAEPEDVRRLVAETRARFGSLTGVHHAAGVVEDALLLTKRLDSLRRVMAPKLHGVVNLDAATRDDDLDYLALYSSASSVLGSVGAADYTAANRFLDAYAERREELRRRGEARGRTLSINWPMWRDGGMRIHPAVEEEVLARAGLEPMDTADGLTALEAAFAVGGHQVIVLQGDPARLERRMTSVAETLDGTPDDVTADDVVTAEGVVTADGVEAAGGVGDAVAARLAAAVADAMGGLAEEDTDAVLEHNFMELGLTSASLVELTELIEGEFSITLPPIALFSHPNVPDLAAYLTREHPDAVARWHAGHGSPRAVAADPVPLQPTRHDADADADANPGPGPGPGPATAPRPAAATERDIAVIGMAGLFPGARDPEELWRRLMAGDDLVTPVPGTRWDHTRYYDPDGRPGTTDCGHGAFLDAIDTFDAAFFHVLPEEAESMDPQLRLLLQVLHATAEDAGVAPLLRGSRTGMFVGQCFQDYDDEMVARRRPVQVHDPVGIAVAMTANRPSFHFDLSGPSLTIDTACSSSLYALHLAVEALRRGECDMAFAAGTNLIVSPRHYLNLSAIGALSPSGRCHSFDSRADGYVPGEAVAAVLLKPLTAALADGDPVHAVVKGVAANHGGHASSVTAPSPTRQAELLRSAWRDAGIDPATLGYLEAHGTGTRLGDPVETEAVRTAFRDAGAAGGTGEGVPPTPRCTVGTAKAHLGHTEGAAGITGVIKAILSLRHGQIPAMPGFREPNELCGLDGGPLRVNREPERWTPPPGVPRRAGVSSFGFGGAYAHAVLEEAPARARGTAPAARGLVFPFSARDDDRLRALLRRFAAFLEAGTDASAAAIATTLQHGREAMAARRAVVATSTAELAQGIAAHLADWDGPRVRETCPPGRLDAVLTLARRWTDGAVVEWPAGGVRVPLPTYAFREERYWLRDPVAPAPAPAPPSTLPSAPAPYSGRHVLAGLRRFGVVSRRLAAHVLRTALGGTGLAPGERLADRMPVVPVYERFAESLDALLRDVAPPHDGEAAERARIDADITSLKREHPEIALHVGLVETWTPELPGVLTGDVDALSFYFPGGAEGLPRVYSGNPVADHYNALITRAVADHVAAKRARHPSRALRVLEVGAGTGGTSVMVLKALAEHGEAVTYHFTDISPTFFRAAEERLTATATPLRFEVFDLNADPEPQGFTPGTFDVVIATNALHATRSITDSLARLRRTLTADGVLVLNELTANLDYLPVMFGMLPGWAAEDTENRLPGSPLLDAAGWRAALDQAGFGATEVHGADGLAESEYDQAVIVSHVPENAGRAGAAPAAVGRAPATPRPGHARPSPPAEGNGDGDGDGTARLRRHLRAVFADFLRLDPATVDDHSTFERYGLDSLGAIQLARTLETDFGALPKVVLYECRTIAALADYLSVNAPEACAALDTGGQETAPTSPTGAARHAPVVEARHPDPNEGDDDPVAIVGMAGVFPGSPDLPALWRHLRAGDHLVTEIPADRFDWRPLFGDPQRTPGTTNSRWGAFIDEVDRFDADFFNISPLEAGLMDPQQRLLLTTAWWAVEDSGHRLSELRGGDTGVFVGATSHDYDGHLIRTGRDREAHSSLGVGHCILSNRISYQFDIHGPSETVDTACSSSLSALHRAVRSIRGGECRDALVGGVHLTLMPRLFVALGQLGVLSPEGRCRPFDENADGFVRGEGVGALYLKPLSRALADGDTVHGIIRGSGVGHGGQVQSMTVPNPAAQADLIASVYRRAGVDPRTVTYIEAHGTGTLVGDPIEVRGLKRSFEELTGISRTEAPWCGLGSVKSNLGHLEAAAGLVGVLKVLLAFRHGQIPASVNFERPNPLLELDGSPFHVIDRLTPWRRVTDQDGSPVPRRAGVSSLGFGGTNCHVLLEEHLAPPLPEPTAPPEPRLVVLSARTEERLRAYAGRLHDHLTGLRADGEPDPALADVAHTLSAGRDPMPWRLAVLATGIDDLVTALGAVRDGAGPRDGLWLGHAPDTPGDLAAPGPRAGADELARHWIAGGAPPGATPDGDGRRPRRLPLPGYPFAGDRHWSDGEHTNREDRAPRTDGAGRPPAGTDWQRLLSDLRDGARSIDEVDDMLVLNDGTPS